MSGREKEKVVFQTRSRVVTLPKFNQEEYEDSEDEDYEPSEEEEEESEEEELVGKKRATNKKNTGNTPKKQKVIDLDAEVIEIDDDNENEKKDNVNKIWEEMNKEKEIVDLENDNKKNNKEKENVNNNNEEKDNNNNNSNNNNNNNNQDDNNENQITNSDNIQSNSTNKDENNKRDNIENNISNPTNTNTTTATTTASPSLKEQVEIVEFAGEKIEVKKQNIPTPPKPMSKKKAGGLDGLLSNLGGKPKKINTLEKSKLDWDKFKNESLDETEKHTIEQQKKDGYLEKEAFLQRTGENEYQEKLNLLKKLNK